MEIRTVSGKQIRKVGLGTFPFQGEMMANIIQDAVEAGYRLFDTADDYRGEIGIGMAMNRHFVNRQDVFLQTKISNDTAYADEPLAGVYFNPLSKFMKRHTVSEIVNEKVHTSLRKMNTDYLDSVLIHYPYPGYYEEIWSCLQNLRDQGKIRFIGVSNFSIRHLEVLRTMGESPSINEIYISPIGTKEEMVSYAIHNGIQIMTYSPLMDLTRNNLNNGILVKIGDRYGKSNSQIVLRWNIERGCIPLAKTKSKSRMMENMDVENFKLTQEEIEEISSMNRDFQILKESRICPGL